MTKCWTPQSNDRDTFFSIYLVIYVYRTHFILSLIIIHILFIYVYRILFMFIDHNKHTLVKNMCVDLNEGMEEI